MQIKHFKERYCIEYYSSKYRIWDKKNEVFVGVGFTCKGEANLFYDKLSYFLFDYDDLKLNEK